MQQVKNSYHNRGFTMVEIMIVVIIIAVLAGAVSLTINVNSEQREVARQSLRLQHVIGYAHNHAVFSGNALGMEVFENGIRFLSIDAEDFDFMEWGLQQTKPNDPNDPFNQANQAGNNIDTEDTETEPLKWKLETEEKALRQKALPENMVFALEIEDEEIEIDTLDAVSDDDEDESAESNFRPQIFFSDSGTVTPFIIKIVHTEKNINWELQVSMTGEIEENPDEDE